MAEEYTSQLDYMRKRALREKIISLKDFWEEWTWRISKQLEKCPEEGPAQIQYYAESFMFKSFCKWSAKFYHTLF